jgi:alkanesulfonate monooxygenase SsuD/methylene tetrahydromethanopterin reductase-like flavin-dependent oxidoreductase (luciferase family)
MRLGIYLNSQHPESEDPARRFAETVEQVRLIRSLGFDSIWAGEHHITPGFHFFPQLGLLQRLAADAEGLWLGTNVLLLPLHNPIELAEVGAFMDVITGGKFLLGVGLGYRPEEYAIYGIPMAERVSRLSEAVGLIRRLWTEKGVTHNGRHWRFSEATIAPRPLQSPSPPSSEGRSSLPLPELRQSAMAGSLCRSLRSTRLPRIWRPSPPRARRPSSPRARTCAVCWR